MLDLLECIVKRKDEFVIGITSSLSAVFLIGFFQTFWSIVIEACTSRLRVRRLFGFSGSHSYYVVSGVFDQLEFESVKGQSLTNGPDMTATANICQTIKDIYRKSTVVRFYSDSKKCTLLQCNLVSVGGPRFNYCTTALLKDFSNDIYFEQGDLHFFGVKYSRDVCNSKDYGLVVRRINPYSDRDRAVVIAGCSSHGVLAASSLFEKRSYSNTLLKTFRRHRSFNDRLINKDFCAVVECTTEKDTVSNVKVVSVRSF